MTSYRYQPLPSRRVFLKSLARGAMLGLGLLGAGLGVGVLGYHYIARLSWIDSLLNSAMLLGGEGPVGTLGTVPAKLWASFYALFGGVLFLSVVGVLLAPAVYRFMHRFHLEVSVPVERTDESSRKTASPDAGS